MSSGLRHFQDFSRTPDFLQLKWTLLILASTSTSLTLSIDLVPPMMSSSPSVVGLPALPLPSWRPTTTTSELTSLFLSNHPHNSPIKSLSRPCPSPGETLYVIIGGFDGNDHFSTVRSYDQILQNVPLLNSNEQQWTFIQGQGSPSSTGLSWIMSWS
jgi:hypothetical protein